MLSIALGLPVYGGMVASQQVQMWLNMGRQAVAWGDSIQLGKVIEIDTCGVDRARNFLLAQAMMLDDDWLLMIDADTWANGVDVLRMIISANAADATIIGAPVYRRVRNDQPDRLNVYRLVTKDGRQLHEAYEALDLKAVPNVFGADAVGAAVMAVNLRKLGAFERDQNIVASFKFTDQLSEDLEFCRQIREAGGKILVDKRVETGHLARVEPMRYEP